MTLSVIIPALDAANVLPATLAALAGAEEIIVADGGSTDATAAVAAQCGAIVLAAPRGRGPQLAAGAQRASGDWLLFLHADTVLALSWRAEALAFCRDPANLRRAGVFRFALDDDSAQARRLEALVRWRTRAMGLPYGDQGLLLSRAFYDSLGGFRPLPLMEDVDMVRRIGRRAIVALSAPAATSAERWRRDGWRLRSLRNLACLALYFAGAPPRFIQRIYG
ncbi:MAG: TIGR04283 family arsenosugar biosynthesis glycosyltransferase [Methylocystis sp.]|nr:TIGR04283 family arsenosugar biosynthesis glycosyltransferase [Methylocystis sp.]